MAADGSDIDDQLSRLQDLGYEEHFRNRLRPSIRRLLEVGAEAYVESERLNSRGNETMSSALTSNSPSLSLEELETLLSSPLVVLTPSEMKRARLANYPIFKDNSDEFVRFSYLFDEIPFHIEEPLNKSKLLGEFEVYYHDEKIDWHSLEGWEVNSNRQAHEPDEGLICIGRAENNTSRFGGFLFFVPENLEGLIEESSDDESERSNDDSNSDTDNFDDDDDGEEEDSGDDEEGGQSFDSGEDESVVGSDESTVGTDEGEGSDNEVGEVRSIASLFREKYTFFHFDERHFVPDDSYQNASWYASDGECPFGLTRIPQRNEEEEGEVSGSVSLMRANESMAFSRGDVQQFISLEDPSNYGTNCGSNYNRITNEDETQRMHVVERMQAYRGSWICKLGPTGTMIPGDVAQLICEYWQTSPPPFLFVNKGDLLLLARYEERHPDPDFPDMMSATVTREHLFLARSTKPKDD